MSKKNSHHSRPKGNRQARPKGKPNTRSRKPKLVFGDVEDLNHKLKEIGLYAADTVGDGNCLFRALSDQYHGTPKHHALIRRQICDFLQENAAVFEMFVLREDDSELSTTEAFNQRLESMREDGTYGDHLEIQAWCNLTLRDIVIIQANLIYFIKPSSVPDNNVKRSPPPILYTNLEESPREVRKRKRDERSKLLDNTDDVYGQRETRVESMSASAPMKTPLYIIYHDWEHYSSARNLDGPHTGFPEVQMKQNTASNVVSEDENSVNSQSNHSSDDLNYEEQMILRSLRFPEKHSITFIRKLIREKGDWNDALEYLIERENTIESSSEDDQNNDHTPTSSSESQSVSHSSSPEQAKEDLPSSKSTPAPAPSPLGDSYETNVVETSDRPKAKARQSLSRSSRTQTGKSDVVMSRKMRRQQAKASKKSPATNNNDNMPSTFRELHI